MIIWAFQIQMVLAKKVVEANQEKINLNCFEQIVERTGGAIWCTFAG